MTSETNTTRAHDAEPAAAVPRIDADPVDADATVLPVGTFAAGQSADGRYVAVTAAPQGSFAEGQADEDDTAPEVAGT